MLIIYSCKIIYMFFVMYEIFSKSVDLTCETYSIKNKLSHL